MNHCDLEPGSECPGSLQTWSYAVASGDFRRRHRCPVCGARWRADGFHGEFRRLPARVTRSPFQQTSDADGVRQMKIRIGANEKMGKDGYGSYGSSIELEISRDDELTVDQVCSDVAAWQTILDRLVQQDMARKAAALPPKPEQRPQSRLEGRPSAARQPEPEPPPAERPPRGWNPDDVPPRPSQRRPEPGWDDPPQEPQPRPQNGYGGRQQQRNGQRDDPPRTGKQLLGWAYNHQIDNRLKALAKAWDLGRIVDWSEDNVSAAYRELSRQSTAAGSWGGN